MLKNENTSNMSSCKKCGMPGNIVLRKKDHYCTDCFKANINHKFRACIGKNKILHGNENVLICLSGGPCSTVLMDLVHNGISLNNHKKLSITPVFFHLMGISKSSDDEFLAKSLIRLCNNNKFNVVVGHISDYIHKENIIPEVNTILQAKNDSIIQFSNLISSMSVSSRIDFIAKVSRDMYIQFAKLLQCHYIFTGETLGTLATNLLTNLTIGRGSQVQYDVGFCDSRNETIILRPMKDISQEEIDQYIISYQLELISSSSNQENCLQSIIKNFVTDLQDNYQATVSTVCKTADKIGVKAKGCKKCKVCESDVGEKNDKLSAFEATNYSSTVSMGHKGNVSENPNDCAIFPHINQSLCYTCSKMFPEMGLGYIPQFLKEM